MNTRSFLMINFLKRSKTKDVIRNFLVAPVIALMLVDRLAANSVLQNEPQTVGQVKLVLYSLFSVKTIKHVPQC